MSFVDMMLNNGDLGNAEYSFIAIAPRSTLILSGKTWQGPFYESNRTNYVYKQTTDAKLWLFYSSTWNHLIVCNKEHRLI